MLTFPLVLHTCPEPFLPPLGPEPSQEGNWRLPNEGMVFKVCNFKNACSYRIQEKCNQDPCLSLFNGKRTCSCHQATYSAILKVKGMTYNTLLTSGEIKNTILIHMLGFRLLKQCEKHNDLIPLDLCSPCFITTNLQDVVTSQVLWSGSQRHVPWGAHHYQTHLGPSDHININTPGYEGSSKHFSPCLLASTQGF